MLRDVNHIAHMTLDAFNVAICAPTPAFSATLNTRGDFDGTAMPFTLYTVTGDVLVRMYGVCSTTLTGASATISVGVTGNTAKLIASTTATSITSSANFWADATPYTGTDLLTKVTGPFVVVNSMNILETIGTADITGGNLYYVCLWRPISQNGNVVASTPA